MNDEEHGPEYISDCAETRYMSGWWIKKLGIAFTVSLASIVLLIPILLFYMYNFEKETNILIMIIFMISFPVVMSFFIDKIEHLIMGQCTFTAVLVSFLSNIQQVSNVQQTPSLEL